MIINFKTFNFPSYKEWSEKDYEFEEVFGAYRCAIKPCSWGYKFAVALANQIPSNAFVDKLFCESFEYVAGDVAGLEEWYNKTVEKFNDFWQAYMNSTYVLNGVKLVVAVEGNQLEQEIKTVSVYDTRKQRFWTDREIHERGVEKFLNVDNLKETLNWNLNGDGSKYQFKRCKANKTVFKGRAFIFE